MDRRGSPLGVVALVPLGGLVGHQLAELLPHGHDGGVAHAHGHLGALAALALPLAVLGAVRLGVGRPRPAIDLFPLLVLGQVTAFLLMEAAEQVAAGGQLTALAASPLFWSGVAAQVAVAVALLSGLRAAGAVRSLAARSRRVRRGPTPPCTVLPRARDAACRPAAGGWPLRRGPPLLVR